MGETAIFRKEDSVAIPVAIALHVGVVALLVLQPAAREIAPVPPRMSVNLASEISLESTAPDIVSESSAAIAPVLSDEIGAVADDLTVEDAATETPAPAAVPSADTTPTTTAPAAPTRRTTTTRRQSPNRERSRPDRTRPAATPRSRPTSAPAQPTRSGGGSRIGDDFLPGSGSSTTTRETRPPAARFGRRERAALIGAISRQLRPHWTAPNGVDAELLISTVSWELNSDGSLRGTPSCRTDPGSINASNRPQASLHCDRAIRAVRRAAPFNLPEQFYDRWDELEFNFDRRL